MNHLRNIILWGFALLVSQGLEAQLSKSSPFLSQKNFLSANPKSSLKESGLALVQKSCLPKNFKIPDAFYPDLSPSSQDVAAWSFDSQKISQKDLLLFLQSPCVLGVGNNEIAVSSGLVPNDPLFGEQLFYRYNDFLRLFSAFKSPSLRQISPVTVAVVDSGISLSHMEFAGQFWTDSAGHHGYNFIDGNFDIEDKAGHGSHVAGLIAAKGDNGVGVIGVAQNARLMILKTQGVDGNGTLGNVTNAIRYAVDHGADVINLSLAIPVDTPFMRDAVDYALERGVVVIAASGNNGKQITVEDFISPAGLAPDKDGLISVGSVDSFTGELSFFSNYSNSLVEIAAPGSHDLQHILSTYKEERYFSTAGTSMSAPQVSGAAALVIGHLKAHDISYRPADIERLILQGSKRNGKLSDFIQNGRELNFDFLKDVLFQRHHLSSDGGLNE